MCPNIEKRHIREHIIIMWWMMCLQENAGGEVERWGRAHSPHIHREQGVHLQVEEGQWNEWQNIPFAYLLTWPAAHLQIEGQWNEWQNVQTV